MSIQLEKLSSTASMPGIASSSSKLISGSVTPNPMSHVVARAHPAPAPAPAPQVVDLNSAFLPPSQVVKSLEAVAVTKCNLPITRMFLLGMLSGVYIGMGGTSAITLGKGMPGNDKDYPGLNKFAFGAVFPVGLVLVIIAGSELITGNFAVLIPAMLNGKVKWYQVLNNWFWVYSGNFVGSIAFAYFWGYMTNLFYKDPWLSGVQGIAELKVSYDFWPCFLSAMGCNWLVCLAVFMAAAAKTITCKVMVIWWPIMTFATIGYEHSVANMFFIPLGMLYGANVSWAEFIGKNLVPVTLGNASAAILFVATVYWYIYSMPSGWPESMWETNAQPKIESSVRDFLASSSPAPAMSPAPASQGATPSSEEEGRGKKGRRRRSRSRESHDDSA